MKKILFIVHKSSERAFQDCINSINELKKPMLFNTMLVTYDDNGVSAVSNAYLEACRTENPDISIIMDDTVLFVNEKCLREIIDIFKSDSQIGVIGVKGADCLPDSGNIDEAENVYGGFYEMNCQGEVFEKKYATVSSIYLQVEAVSSLLLAVRGYIPVWSGINGRCIGEALSAAAAIHGYKTVIAKNANTWCFSTIPEVKPTAKDLQFIREKYSFKNILFGKNHCLLTIGIPTYNRATYFGKCISNLYNQIGDMPWIEVFVSNNNSTDDTEKIASQYLCHKNFRYYRQPTNLRVDKNFDYLYEKASGDFVIACGDDDYYTGEAILGLLEAICLYPDSSVMILKWSEIVSTDLPSKIISHNRGMDNFLPECTRYYTCISCVVLNHEQYVKVRVKDKFAHTLLNQCYTQLEILRNVAVYSVVGGNNFFSESGEASRGRIFALDKRQPFCDIFIRRYYEILDYYLDRGLSRYAYEKEKKINLGKIVTWLDLINTSGNTIQWRIDEDLEALMEKYYGYEPYYDDLKQKIKHILEAKLEREDSNESK